jgi:hypothetical protein
MLLSAVFSQPRTAVSEIPMILIRVIAQEYYETAIIYYHPACVIIYRPAAVCSVTTISCLKCHILPHCK